jgi:DNA-binding MarR family transcriptional regulator
MPDTDPLHPVTARDERILPWRAFLVAHARITRRLDEELRAEHDLTLGEYDALLALAEAGDRRLRMNTLADRVILSKSGVTRLIDRLVADGLVVRDQCVTDARGAEAVLTDKGLERLRRASRTHLRGIERHFFDVVDPADLGAIRRAMVDVAEHAEQDPRPTTEPAAAG